MPNIFSGFRQLITRLLPSGLYSRHHKLTQHDYLKRKSFWQANSIYLENIYNKIATDAAMMRFKHVRINRKKGSPDEWEWFEFSDLAQAVGLSPNLNDTPLVFWADVIREIVENGVAVVVPVYKRGVLTSIELAGGAAEYKDDKIIVDINGEPVTLNRADVWIFENPKRNLTAQLGQITALIDSNLQNISEKLNTDQNSKLKGFLKLPTQVEDGELRKKAESRIENIYNTASAGGIGYLQKGEEFQELTRSDYTTASTEELEFLKQQLYQAFGINEDLFTCNYTEEQYRAYYQSVVKVYIRLIRDEINRKFFTQTARTQGHRLLVYIDLFDVASLKDLNEFAFKQKYSGNMSSNEIREIFGYGAYSGGEVFETNRNAVPIGQALGGGIGD